MKILIKDKELYDDAIMCMANVRGNSVNVPHSLPFSFYFSRKNSSHGIRVKVVFNPNRLNINDCGNLVLHSNWTYTPGRNDNNVNSKQKNQMIDFFKEYKALFAAVWEDVIQEDVIQDYFRGMISWNQLVESFDFYEEYKDDLDKISDVQSLEKYVRENEIFNMND